MKIRALAMFPPHVPAAVLAQETMTDCQRAAAPQKRCESLVVDSPDPPVWIEGTSRFRCRTSVSGCHAFVLVDAAVTVKKPALGFDRRAADAPSVSFVADSVNWMAEMPEAPADRTRSVRAGTACWRGGMHDSPECSPG